MLKRLFPDIRSSEAHRFRFFFLLAGLIMASQSTAMTVCESLLLSRLGIEALPYSVLAASALTMVCSFIYSKRVGRIRNEYMLLILIAISVTVILSSIPLVLAKSKAAYVGIFAFHFVTFTVFTGHLQALADDYFDTLAAKRIMPLVGVGATAGEIAGGLSASAITKIVPVEGLLAVWAMFLIAAAIFTVRYLEQLKVWNPVAQKSQPSAATTHKSVSMMKVLKSAPLHRSLVGTVCFMILAMSMAQYVVSDVFVKSFPNENDLASFLGIFVACSNALELVIASQITPRLLRRLGIATTNLVHSVLALATLALLWNHYALIPAMLTWMNRKTVHDALGRPVRRLLFNACNPEIRIPLMAFINGVAGSAARALASLFLFVLQDRLDAPTFVTWGIGFSVFYFGFAILVGRDYLKELTSQVAKGRLRLGEDRAWDERELPLLWAQSQLDPKEQDLRRLAELLDAQNLGELLVAGIGSKEPLIRRICAEQLGARCPASCLQDSDPKVRLAACAAHWQSPDLLVPLLEDQDDAVRRRARAASGKIDQNPTPDQIRHLHIELLDQALAALEHAEPEYQAAALSRLSGEFCISLERVFQKAQLGNAEVSQAAVESLGGWRDPLGIVLLTRCLEHERARTRQAASRVLSGKGPIIVPHLKPYFRHLRKVVAEAAYEALSGMEDAESRTTLGQELRLLVREAWKSLVLQNRIEALQADSTDPALHFLCLALEDRSKRCQSLAFKVLSLLEDETVVGSVVSAIRFSDAAKQATALEILSNLGDREAAGLLVLLTESSGLAERIVLAQKRSPSLEALPHEREPLLEQCLQSAGRFVNLGALCALGRSSSTLPQKLSSLKDFDLFQNLSLEELRELESLLVEERFHTDETILEAGEPCHKIYLLVQGQLSDGSVVAGEVPTLDGGTALTTVTATRNSRLWSLTSHNFRQLIKHQPSVVFPLFRRLARRVKETEASALSRA